MAMTAREKRKKHMTENGYFSLSSSERAERLRQGIDSLKDLVSSLSEEARKRLEKGDINGSHEY
ncbi:MAG: hypothetical protein ACYDEQ_05005 [Desulfocucumaceae bacterium]